jgi:proton glutamate symport protein
MSIKLPSTPTLAIIGMVLGLLAGLLSDSLMWGVANIADSFFMLLQMTALPYISLSLIAGVGKLTPRFIKETLKSSLMMFSLLLVLCVLVILSSSLVFPDWVNASFYNANTIQTSDNVDFVKLFIPSNPFSAYANTVVPSVVVFSLFVGFGLRKVAGKQATINVLESLLSAIANVNSLITKWSPVGIFCIVYRAIFTFESSLMDGLLIYLITASTVVILLSFIILPLFVTSLSQYSYKQVFDTAKEPMLLAFATGSFFAVIPIIVEKVKLLFDQTTKKHRYADFIPEIIVPITFSLPVGGKMLCLLFALFASWVSGAHISVSDYFILITQGIPQLFGTRLIAMPGLLELLNAPASMLDTFILADNLMMTRLGTVFSVAFAVCLPIAIMARIDRKLESKWRPVAGYFGAVPILLLVVFSILNVSFDKIGYQYNGYQKFIERELLEKRAKYTVKEAPKDFSVYWSDNSSTLERIKERGSIRVGYFRDDLPYSFVNNNQALVGFDIELINSLANDLNVSIEYIKIYHSQAAGLLEKGYIDITTGLPLIPDNMQNYGLTIPYTSQSLAFVVKKERRTEFSNWLSAIEREEIEVGVPEAFFYQNKIASTFTKAKAWKISSPRLFFKKKHENIDAMLFGAPAASAWTLIYPEYTVVVPKPSAPALQMAFPINKSDTVFENFMRSWINSKIQDKTIDKFFDYWIKGQALASSKAIAEKSSEQPKE